MNLWQIFHLLNDEQNTQDRQGYQPGTLHDDVVDTPRKWKKSRVIFVNSMSNLFHKDVPLKFIQRVFTTMRECPQHTFQILTKRSGRLREIAKHLEWPDNIWMGVSVENEKAYDWTHT